MDVNCQLLCLKVKRVKEIDIEKFLSLTRWKGNKNG